MIKHKIVLVPFPFDDLSATKVLPAVCLTDEIRPYGHVVLAFITSQVSDPAATDLIIRENDADFAVTGLKVSSAVRLHRLMTISKSVVKRQLGQLSPQQTNSVNQRLRQLFQL
jgi:mRNA interferase MazF